MAQTIEDVESRTLLQQFHSLYKKQDAIETNVENVDAKVEQVKNNTAQIANLINSKQDKLTAGTNITIDENNVISASGGGTSGRKYQHYMIAPSSIYRPHWIIENNQIEAFTMDTLKSYLASKGYTKLKFVYPVNSAIDTHLDEEDKRYLLNISNVDGLYVDENNILQLACYDNQIIFDFTDGSVGANKKWKEVNVDFFIDKVTEL